MKIQSIADYESYFLNNTILGKKKNFLKEVKEQTISYIISQKFIDYKTMWYICLLGPDKLDVEQLHDFLAGFFEEKIKTNLAHPTDKSEFRRLIRIYDWLKYGNKK